MVEEKKEADKDQSNKEQPTWNYYPPEAEAALRNEHAASVDAFLDKAAKKREKPV